MNKRLAALLTLFTLGSAVAVPPAAPTLNFQTGNISILGGKATVNTGRNLRYLGQQDARAVIVDLWGNPPQAAEDVVGMIVPAALNLNAQESWGVVVTESQDGHVSDSDAAKLDYAKLMRDMQAGTRENNAEREKAGYGSIDLIGWADTPRYDPATHKMYWAKELAFNSASEPKDPEHTLNYAVRVLGRTSVLELNAVAGMSQLPQVKRDMQGVLQQVSFTPGNRYEDFKPGSDKVAEYGIAGLLGVVAAKKVGLLAGGLLLLKKGWILLLAAFSGLARMFRRGAKGEA